MAGAASLSPHTEELPTIRELTMDHPWQWLGAGWKDMRAQPALSLAYGLVFVLVGYVLTGALIYADAFYLFPPLASGFFLVAPVLAVGLYETSRRVERGEAVTLRQAYGAWHRNGSQIIAMGVILMLVFLAWLRLATLVFPLLFQGITPTWDHFIDVVFLAPDSLPALVGAILLGGVLAVAAFTISVVSVPALLDGKASNAVDAVILSWAAVRRNPRPMLLWAGLIVACVGVGLVTFYVGMLVAMPVVGYATWHAYRDTVG